MFDVHQNELGLLAGLFYTGPHIRSAGYIKDSIISLLVEIPKPERRSGEAGAAHVITYRPSARVTNGWCPFIYHSQEVFYALTLPVTMYSPPCEGDKFG